MISIFFQFKSIYFQSFLIKVKLFLLKCQFNDQNWSKIHQNLSKSDKKVRKQLWLYKNVQNKLIFWSNLSAFNKIGPFWSSAFSTLLIESRFVLINFVKTIQIPTTNWIKMSVGSQFNHNRVHNCSQSWCNCLSLTLKSNALRSKQRKPLTS